VRYTWFSFHANLLDMPSETTTDVSKAGHFTAEVMHASSIAQGYAQAQPVSEPCHPAISRGALDVATPYTTKTGQWKRSVLESGRFLGSNLDRNTGSSTNFDLLHNLSMPMTRQYLNQVLPYPSKSLLIQYPSSYSRSRSIFQNKQNKLRGPSSASELYRPSDRHLSAKF
jgi:hypothetical protein